VGGVTQLDGTDVAVSGILQNWDHSAAIALLLLGTLVVSVAVGVWRGRHAARRCRSALVAVQSFRLLPDAMHALVAASCRQMSYSGRNDIVTGRGDCRRARALADAGWSPPECALTRCHNVVTVAIASTAVQAFRDANVVTFVTYALFVWLPAVMVAAALAGQSRSSALRRL
jgi:hypothetical protein